MRHPLLQKYDRLIEFFGQMLGQDYELSLTSGPKAVR